MAEAANNDNNNEQPQQQNREHLNLKVKAQDGTEVCFKCNVLRLK